MKKFFLILLLLSFSNISFKIIDRKLISDKRDLQDFSKIEFSAKGNLHVQQGEHELVQIIAHESLIPYIKTELTDRTLHIDEKSLGWFMSFKSFEPYNVYVTVKNIDTITFTGPGTLRSEKPIKEKELTLNVTGSSKVNLSLNVESLHSTLTGSPEFNLRGTASDQNITITGSGHYNSLKVLGKTATVNMTDGEASLNIQEKLNVKISGKGTVTYMGSPKITQQILGTGKIEELK